MANKPKYPLGLYKSGIPKEDKLNIKTHETRVEDREQTEFEIPEQISIGTTSVVFINGELISQSEYTISDNIITFNTPLKQKDVLTVMK
jgi:subtilase family serine protease